MCVLNFIFLAVVLDFVLRNQCFPHEVMSVFMVIGDVYFRIVSLQLNFFITDCTNEVGVVIIF